MNPRTRLVPTSPQTRVGSPSMALTGSVAAVPADSETGAATIYDVARRAEVSISTVSQTLNRPTRVSAMTRERVLEAIRDLAYKPKGAAVSQARRGVGRIGVFGPFTSYDSYSRRLAGVMRESAGKDRDIVVYDQESAAATVSPLLRTLPVTGRLDGLLIMGLPVDDRLVEQLNQRRIPAVLVDSWHSGLSSVNIDDEHAGGMVGAYLLARGHTSFAFVHELQVSSAYRSAAQRRVDGLVRVVYEAGLPDNCVTEVTTTNSVDGGRDALSQIMQLVTVPTAVFAHHDTLAAGVLLEARKRGLNVPDDIAVVGFDDSPLAAAVGLTTIRQPFEESGRLGTSLLGTKIRGGVGAVQQQIVLGLELITRDTA